MRNLEAIKLDIKGQIETAEKQIALWQKVERVRKKDGGDFAAIGRNFRNANVELNRCAMRDDDLELVVSDLSPAGGYVKDTIDLKVLVKYAKVKPSPDRVKKYLYYEPYYMLNATEIEQAIKERIIDLGKKRASLRDQLRSADAAYEKFTAAVDAALADLKSIAGDGTTLYYGCREYMRGAY